MADTSEEPVLQQATKELDRLKLDESHDQPISQEEIEERERNEVVLDSKGDKFEPVDVKKAPLIDAGLPPEIWTIIQSAPANFAPQYFLDVSRTLLENPNLTASHLSRAELSYKSFADASFNPEAQTPHALADIIKHLKVDHQPRIVAGGIPGYKLEWTVVRKLIPRNPKLDEPLLQTCHLFTSTEDARVLNSQDSSSKSVKIERYLVMYIPHVSDPDSIPFYHPKVRGLAILYTYQPHLPSDSSQPPGTLSLYYDIFPTRPLDNRMTRTALKMLEIIHKHARGRMTGYQKRVHHDVIIAQKPFQDTYAYLKGKYAKDLIDGWVEQTPAQKHVFEDLGIAAFLMELWTNMYGGRPVQDRVDADSKNPKTEDDERLLQLMEDKRRDKAKEKFPGFVDIGCGNGLLVSILNREGWHGWGFDARRRKTWDTFGSEYDDKLKERLLVPEVLKSEEAGDDETVANAPPSHNGIFPTRTFIISNHADELTAWTPILAFLSESPFLAIPCCSHNFGGTRFRAPYHAEHNPSAPPLSAASSNSNSSSNNKQPSAYASLCSYVSHLTALISYVPEKEHLRIPSTRNIAIIGRHKAKTGELMGTLDDKLGFVRELVEREMGGETSIEQVRLQWLKRGSGLMKPGKGGH